MNRIYGYNPDASYKSNQGTYLQQIGSKVCTFKILLYQNMINIARVFKLNFQTSLLIIRTVE